MKKDNLILVGVISFIVIIMVVILVISSKSANVSDKNIYLFYGDGCGYCHELQEYLDSLPNNIKSKFNLVEFETWYDDDNLELAREFALYFEEESDGVPYLIIGDKTFTGYSSTFNDDILDALNNLEDNYIDVYEIIKK